VDDGDEVRPRALDTFVNFTPPAKLRPDGTFSRKERFGVQY
jgi:hypothetical protein